MAERYLDTAVLWRYLAGHVKWTKSSRFQVIGIIQK